MRINKFLSNSGIGSRRKCDELIALGKVSINNKKISDFSYQVNHTDIVKVNGKNISNQKKIIFKLNKPIGYISTSSDPKNKAPTVISLIDTKLRLYTVGRLDLESSGIILVTNNGNLCYKLTHPKFEIEKKYFVKTKQKIDQNKINMFEKGYKLNDNKQIYHAKIKLKSIKNDFYVWKIILKEGKKREIRNIFKFFNTKIYSLHRYSFANIKLNNLKKGQYKKLTNHEMKVLNNILE